MEVDTVIATRDGPVLTLRINRPERENRLNLEVMEGLLNWVVPDEDFEEAVRSRARTLAALPRSAVRIGRRTFAGLAGRNFTDGYGFSAARLVDLLTDPDVAATLAGGRGKG